VLVAGIRSGEKKEEAREMGGRNAVNEATQRLARTSVGSYKALMDNTMALQELNVRFALGIIHGSLGQLRRQVESNQTITRGLIERTEEQQNAFQTLVGRSANAYVSLFLAPFHYFREGSRFVTAEDVEGGGNGSLPIENYDKLTVGEVSDKIGGLSGREIRALRSYERRHKNRGELLERLDRSLV
jgi:hypothetical protein